MTYIISREKNAMGYQAATKNHSFIKQFVEWSASQDAEHHIAWTGVSLVATTAVLFPLTMAVILLNGASFQLIITAMISLVLVVSLNLAALPTRYTIPALLTGILIDAGVIAASLLLS